MCIGKRATRLALLLTTLLVISIAPVDRATATGISIDAGLTPAENRWIFRSQIRFMQRDNETTPTLPKMKSYMFPVIIAYGLRSNVTVMLRQVIRRNEMIMGEQSSSTSGLTDLLLMSKFRLVRVNTPTYTIGIAPTVGVELPTGNENFTSNSWDLRMGCYFSGRIRSWGMDLDARYVWNGLAKTESADFDPGNEFSLAGALANQLVLGADANFTLAPVIEFSYKKTSSDSNDGVAIANTGESVFFLSPGIKVTRSSLILESLIQFPIWQNQNGLQTKRTAGFLIGVRLMR